MSLDCYAQCNAWLFPKLATFRHWTDREFDEIVDRLKRLPKPTDAMQQSQLVHSSLGITLSNLATKIRTESSDAGGTEAAQESVPALRVVCLWNATRQLSECYHAHAYASFFRTATHFGLSVATRL